jgi:hypothetical protein
MNQSHFFNFFFHLIDVSVGNEVTVEKKPQFTIFAHRKWWLWKSGGLGFGI